MTPALTRLLALATRFRWSPALAAIPAAADRSLSGLSADHPGLRLLVHGLRHADHAPAGAKSAEFGAHRAPAERTADLVDALGLARSVPGPWLPVFVPPWNRIAPEAAAALPGLGYGGLSAFGPRPLPVTGLVVANTHLDPVDWHGGRGLRDVPALVAGLAALLREAPGPIGLLTHHLVHDEATWAFLEGLIGRLSDHSAVRLLSPEAVFPPAGVATVIER